VTATSKITRACVLNARAKHANGDIVYEMGMLGDVSTSSCPTMYIEGIL